MLGNGKIKALNQAINYAIDEAGSEGLLFLTLWREGNWDAVESEFPGFDLLVTLLANNI